MVASTDLRARSLEQLDRYCEQTAVAVTRIALRIFDAAQPDGELAAELGRSLTSRFASRAGAKRRYSSDSIKPLLTSRVLGFKRRDLRSLIRQTLESEVAATTQPVEPVIITPKQALATIPSMIGAPTSTLDPYTDQALLNPWPL